MCTCPVGYILNRHDERTCDGMYDKTNIIMLIPLCNLVDKDECAIGNGNCAQVCINSEGAHTCACNEGYFLNYYDYETCEGIVSSTVRYC